jgi:3D (Asp-Asp-Asp) domain-containing protein
MTLTKAKTWRSRIKILANLSAGMAFLAQLYFPIPALAAPVKKLALLSQNTRPILLAFESPQGQLLQKPVDPEAAPDYPSPDKVVRAVITAYSSTPDQTDDSPFIAASGKRVYDGMIAANWLPFGTKIKIPRLYGDKIFTVDDRMNARYGYGRLDIWLDAPRAEVKKFGVKRVEVEVYYQNRVVARR